MYVLRKVGWECGLRRVVCVCTEKGRVGVWTEGLGLGWSMETMVIIWKVILCGYICKR